MKWCPIGRTSKIGLLLVISLLFLEKAAFAVQIQSLQQAKERLLNRNTISANAQSKSTAATHVAVAVNTESTSTSQEGVSSQTAAQLQSEQMSSSDQEESLSSLMQAYSKVGMAGQEEKKDDKVSEEEAMLAFSSAKLNGVKIMDLPDANPAKAKEKMNEEQEIAVFQANEIEK